MTCPTRSRPTRPVPRVAAAVALAGLAALSLSATATHAADLADASDDAPGAVPGPAAALPDAAPARVPELASPGGRPGAGATPDPEAVLTVLDARAQFGRGGAALAADARIVVERLARRLDVLERVLSVRVIGHADNVGDEADNLALSERRAHSVADAFRERWPDVHTLAVGAGESSPIADNATERGRSLNRRVEIQVIGIARAEGAERGDETRDRAAVAEPARDDLDAGNSRTAD